MMMKQPQDYLSASLSVAISIDAPQDLAPSVMVRFLHMLRSNIRQKDCTLTLLSPTPSSTPVLAAFLSIYDIVLPATAGQSTINTLPDGNIVNCRRNAGALGTVSVHLTHIPAQLIFTCAEIVSTTPAFFIPFSIAQPFKPKRRRAPEIHSKFIRARRNTTQRKSELPEQSPIAFSPNNIQNQVILKHVRVFVVRRSPGVAARKLPLKLIRRQSTDKGPCISGTSSGSRGYCVDSKQNHSIDGMYRIKLSAIVTALRFVVRTSYELPSYDDFVASRLMTQAFKKLGMGDKCSVMKELGDIIWWVE